MTTLTGGGGAGGRSRIRVTGSLQRVMPSRPGLPPVLQAELGSGPGRIRLVWLGRSRIPGIEPGRLLAVEGTLSLQRGRRTMYNPRYHLVTAPGAGPDQQAATQQPTAPEATAQPGAR